jgi:hemerythrin-like domain-containing protein
LLAAGRLTEVATMKATKLLEQQHAKVKSALARLSSGQGDRSKLVEEISNDLAAHMAIEQQLFYPTVRSIRTDLVDESYEEHAVAELALKRLRRTASGDPLFRARATVLKELIEHHVEEEETELFPAVEKAIPGAALDELGTKMETLFEEVRKQGFDASVPSTFAKTSADEFERIVEAGANGTRRSARGER